MGTEFIKQATTLISGQDTMFWLAAASVAAGLTILVITGFLYLRGRWRNRRARVRKAAPEARPAASTPSPALRDVQAAAYRAAGVPGPADSGHEQLLARLRGTADTLEVLRDELRLANGEAGDSPLKHPAPAVEYIFRKGVG